jgi:hypothetical protein
MFQWERRNDEEEGKGIKITHIEKKKESDAHAEERNR